MKKKKIGLLPKIVIAIALGIACGLFFPGWLVRIFLTINGLFSNFLGFIIPLLAYGFTLFSGFFTYFASDLSYPWLLKDAELQPLETAAVEPLSPYFTVMMPPLMDVMTSLVLAFTLGLGMSVINGATLKGAMEDFKDIINKVITGVIIPLLPLYIFGIFLNISNSGQVSGVLGVFVKIIVMIFFLTIVLLFIQFFIAGVVSKKNPFRLFRNMLPAYMTALGTQSSAATIPVTLEQTIKNGVNRELAAFVIPLCATIHLSGSTMKIVACAMAIMLMSGMPISFGVMAGFIFMLGIAMVAAPGVPGGALGLLQSMLGFDETAQGLMIALYIAMDSFGTACNVTGDGAIAVIMDRINKKSNHTGTQEELEEVVVVE